MSKLNHNRPSLRLKDNLRKVERALEKSFGAKEHVSTDDAEVDLSWHSNDPKQQKEWDTCINVLETFNKEEHALIKGLSIISTKFEKNTSKKELLEVADELHAKATENTNKAIRTYLLQLIESKYIEGRGEIFELFHKAMVNSANKGIIGAITLLERIEQQIKKLTNANK